MSVITLGPLLENDTCLQITFHRREGGAINALRNEGVSFKHISQEGQSYIEVSFADDSGLSATLNHDLDFDLMNSRTRNHLRTVRRPNESIILKLSESFDQFESDSIYLCYSGEDEFMLFAEQCFRYINKVYAPKISNITDLSLPEAFSHSLFRLRDDVNQYGYNRVYANRYRTLIYKLEEILSDEASNPLRADAEDKLRILKSELRKLRELNSVTHQSKLFQDKVKSYQDAALREFIVLHHGTAVLQDIENSCVTRVKRELSFSSESIEAAQEHLNDNGNELGRLDTMLSSLSYGVEFKTFISKEKPPTLPIERCSQCNSVPILRKTSISQRSRDMFIVSCKCGNQSEKAKRGHEAVVNWNLSNNASSLPCVDGLHYHALTRAELKIYIGEIDKFCSLSSRRFNLLIKLEGNRYQKRFNKKKGMISVLSSINAYVKTLLKESN